MSINKHIDDEVRLKVLEALLKKRSVVPNIRQIQKYTGLHKATIKSTLDFLEKEKALLGFGPKIDYKKFGYKLEVKTIFQIDHSSDKKTWDKFLKQAEKDTNLFRMSAIIGSGTWNILASHLFKDVESYHKSFSEIYESTPNIYSVIKDKQVFYATEPHYISTSRTRTIIDLIKKDMGID